MHGSGTWKGPGRVTNTNFIWFVMSLKTHLWSVPCQKEYFCFFLLKNQPDSKRLTSIYKSHQFSNSAFKSHIILITHGTKEVNKEVFCAARNLKSGFTALSAREWDEGKPEQLINSYTSVAFHTLPATNTACTKGTKHQIVNTSLQRAWIQTPQPWKESLVSERVENLINSADGTSHRFQSGVDAHAEKVFFFFFFYVKFKKSCPFLKTGPGVNSAGKSAFLKTRLELGEKKKSCPLAAPCVRCWANRDGGWGRGDGEVGEKEEGSGEERKKNPFFLLLYFEKVCAANF